MKKVIVILLAVIVVLIGITAALQFIYKDEIFKLVKEEANKTLNAKLDFGTFNLTIFKNFPDLTLTLNNISVDGVDEFEGIRLADMKTTEVTLDLLSVIKGETVSVKSLRLTEPTFHVVILKGGKANYDIAKADEETATSEESEESAAFHVALKNYFVKNANIIYDDQDYDMYTKIEGLTHSGTGDFTQDIFLLNTQTAIEKLTYKMEGIAYLNEVKIGAKCDL